MEPTSEETKLKLELKHSGRLQMAKAVASFEHASIRMLVILNGGAALAGLTFLSSLWTSESGQPHFERVATTLFFFFGGLVFVGFTALTGYISQQWFFEAGGNPDKMRGKTPDWFIKYGLAARRTAWATAIISFVFFLLGILDGIAGLKGFPILFVGGLGLPSEEPNLFGQTIQTFGLLLDIAGASILAWGLFVSPKQAIELGATRWMPDTDEESIEMPAIADRIRQSKNAKWGLGFLIVGFLTQILGIWLT